MTSISVLASLISSLQLPENADRSPRTLSLPSLAACIRFFTSAIASFSSEISVKHSSPPMILPLSSLSGTPEQRMGTSPRGNLATVSSVNTLSSCIAFATGQFSVLQYPVFSKSEHLCPRHSSIVNPRAFAPAGLMN